MKAITIVYALLLMAIAIGCSGGSRKAGVPQGRAADQAAARREAVEFLGELSAAIDVAKQAGYEYLKTVSDCLLRDEQAMHDLFVMTKNAGFDAASSEENSSVLGYVFRDTGDRFFGGLLALESDSVQAAVRDDVLYDLGYGNTTITADEIRHLYPKTFPPSCKF